MLLRTCPVDAAPSFNLSPSFSSHAYFKHILSFENKLVPFVTLSFFTFSVSLKRRSLYRLKTPLDIVSFNYLFGYNRTILFHCLDNLLETRISFLITFFWF